MRNEMKAIQAFVADLEFTGFESVEEAAMVPFEGFGAGYNGCVPNSKDCTNSKNDYGCKNERLCDNTSNKMECGNSGACSGSNNSVSCFPPTGGGSGGGSNSIGFPAAFF